MTTVTCLLICSTTASNQHHVKTQQSGNRNAKQYADRHHYHPEFTMCQERIIVESQQFHSVHGLTHHLTHYN